MSVKSISMNTVIPAPRDVQWKHCHINNQLNPSIIAIAKRDTIPTYVKACDSFDYSNKAPKQTNSPHVSLRTVRQASTLRPHSS